MKYLPAFLSNFLLLFFILASAHADNLKLDAALVHAVDFGNTGQIHRLVAQGANVNARNDIGQTVLERAAQYGNYDAVKVLIDLGANVNSTSNYGGPLTSAAGDLYGNSPIAICRLLLSKGANPNGQPGTETPLMAALREAVGAEEQTNSTMGQIAVSTPDYSSAGRQRALEVAKAEEAKLRRSFLKAEKDRVAKVHETGLQIVRLLIARKAGVNLCLNGTSPLMVAAQAGSADAMRLLIDSGAHSDTSSLDAALGPAAVSGSVSAVKFLLSSGASPNAGGVKQSPVITLAALSDAAESIYLLVNAGANVNARGVNGNTALNLVMLRPDVPAVKFLLSHGADPTIADKDGRTPLYWAKETKNAELIALLQAAGAK